MLDSDASFAFVPEFQTTRRRVAERALLSHDGLSGADVLTSAVFPAIAMPECDMAAGAVKSLASDADLFEGRATGFAQDHGFSALLAPVAAPDTHPEWDLAEAEAPSLFAHEDEEAGLAATEGDASGSADALCADPRPVTPRRPLRFTNAREAGEQAPVSLPVLNLFDGVFAGDRLDHAEADPRLLRSRARALARLAAYEEALPPEQRNLWHDDGTADPAPQPATEARQDEPAPAQPAVVATGSETIQPRRAVRHISVQRRSEARPAPVATIHDPLQDHLHRVRDALYTATPEEEEAAAAAQARQPSLSQRLLAILMHLAVLIFTLPGRLAERMEASIPSLRRGYSLRLASVASFGAALVLLVTRGDPGGLL